MQVIAEPTVVIQFSCLAFLAGAGVAAFSERRVAILICIAVALLAVANHVTTLDLFAL